MQTRLYTSLPSTYMRMIVSAEKSLKSASLFFLFMFFAYSFSSAQKTGDSATAKVPVNEPKVTQYPNGVYRMVPSAFGITSAVRDLPTVEKNAGKRKTYITAEQRMEKLREKLLKDKGLSEREIEKEEINHENSERVKTIVPSAGAGQGSFLDPLVNGSKNSNAPLVVGMPSPSLTFDGASQVDNTAQGIGAVLPPDVNGDVGLNHYVSSVNLVYKIFTKTGAVAAGPFKTSDLFNGLPAGDPCRTHNDGDPIVVYDPLADRWHISQFAITGTTNCQCVAVSVTPDPTGAYYVWRYDYPNNLFNDYPKVGVWPDAYHMTFNQFNNAGTAFLGLGILSQDRPRALAGDPAASVVYTNIASIDPNAGGALPADVDGIVTPPVGMAEVIAEFRADEFGDPNDAIRYYKWVPNFITPASSSITVLPDVVLAPFDARAPNTRLANEVNNGANLDAIGDRLMHRFAYRNLGTQAAPVNSFVGNFSVNVSGVNPTNAGTYQTGIRWFEMRRTADAFSVFDQGTHNLTPGNGASGLNNWMGSVAQDNKGNLALGFSQSSTTQRADIKIAGRTNNMANSGTLNLGEGLFFAASGSQTSTSGRWGDYSAMNVDPIDDCTFWYTQEYYVTNSSAGWKTRVGKFILPTCTPAPKATIQGTITICSSGLPVNQALVAATGGFSRTTGAPGTYSMTVSPGTYTISASKGVGFVSGSAAPVTVVDGQTATVDLCLTGVPVIVATTANLISESCVPANGVIDPGETVTVAFGVQNTGAANTTNDVGTLQSGGGVTSPGAPQNYGVIVAGGPSVSRQFTFTADPSMSCGSNITATIAHMDGASNLGSVTYTLPTGLVSGTSTTISYTGPAVSIPDNAPAGVNIILPVSGITGNIADINFRLDALAGCSNVTGNTNASVTHTFNSDLIFKLTSPGGTTITLISGRGGAGKNFCTVLLDDDGGFPATSTMPTTGAIAGNFAPESPLSLFDGQNANGNWTLNVSDNAAIDVGTLNRFSLIITPRICCTPAPTSFYVDDNSDAGDLYTPGATGNDANPGTAAAPFATIAKAIATAQPGNTIYVDAGTFNESVNISKTLILKGVKADVCAPTRTGAETIVNCVNGIGVNASNVTINGFTIQGQTIEASPGFGYAIYMAPANTGTQLINNIIKNNVVGSSLSNAGISPAQVLIKCNWFDSNNQPGAAEGAGIYTDEFVAGGAVSNALIDSNKFTGNLDAGIDFSTSDATKALTGITISNNLFDANYRAIFLFNTVSSTFNNNVVSNSTGTGSGDIRIWGGVNNFSILNNSFSNGEPHNIRITDDGGINSSNVTAHENSFLGNAKAVQVESGYTGTLDAKCNWYGTSDPPAVTAKITGPVTYVPFLTDGTDNSADRGFQPVPNSCNGTLICESTPTQAYISNTNAGNQAFKGELGMQFIVNAPGGIMIKQLGVFDDGGLGIVPDPTGSIPGVRVAIFNRGTHTMVSGLDVTISGAADAYTGNHRMINITPAINLPQGDYVIVTKGYHSGERNGNSFAGGALFPPGNTGGGAITFGTETSYGLEDHPTEFRYPDHFLDNGDSHVFLAGTFDFTTVVPCGGSTTCESPAAQAYTSSTNAGNQNYTGELGLQFIVNNPGGIIIKQLGAFDDLSNGINGIQTGNGVRVAVFNRATHNIVPGLDVIISGSGDPLIGNHRMKTIPNVTLPPGDYVLVAKGYNGSERSGNSYGTGTHYTPGNTGGGAITFGTETSYGLEDQPSQFRYPDHAVDNGDSHVFLAGSFNFTAIQPCAGPGCESPPAQAYISNTTTGNQAHRGELGMQFIVNNPSGIKIKQLGAFDDGGNGIVPLPLGTIDGVRVAIFNRSTHAMVPGLDATIKGTADAYTGNHRMKNITPIDLPPGDYVIVAKGFHSGERNGNSFNGGGPYVAGDNGGGAITFGNITSYGPDDPNGFGYPGSEGNFGPSPIYLAGTFQFTKNIACPPTTPVFTSVIKATDPIRKLAEQVGASKPAVIIKTKDLKVYPNPTRGLFNVQLDNVGVSKLTIQIMNSNGKLVKQKTIDVTIKTTSLVIPFDLVNMASGVYLVKVQGADGIQTEKIVIQR